MKTTSHAACFLLAYLIFSTEVNGNTILSKDGGAQDDPR